MSKSGKKNILSRVLTGTVVTACAASAIFAAGGSAVPFAARANQGGITRAAVTQMLAAEPKESAVKVEGFYTQLQVLGADYGINLMIAVSGEAKTSGPINTDNMKNVLVNGKPMWNGGTYLNWDYHWGTGGATSTLGGFANLDGSPAVGFDNGLNVFMVNNTASAMNFSMEGNDVITLKKDFVISLPDSQEVVTLGEELHFQSILHKNGEGVVDGIAWKQIDSRIAITQEEKIFKKGDAEKEGAHWISGGLVDTTYEGNTSEQSVTIRTNDAGHINLLNADEDSVDISTEAGWKPSGGLAQVKMQRALSFWVYTTIDRTKFTGLNNGIGISSYDYSAETDSKEFRWNATDVFADSSTLTIGKWNHIVLKLNEAPFNAMTGENDQDQLRYAAMKYFRMFWVNSEGQPIEDLAKEDGIYFSDFRLIESPSQAQIGYELAKVKQFVEPTFTKPAVNGAKQEIKLGLTTRLLNTPGVGEDKITLTSSDPATIKVEKDTDGKWYATALKMGKASISAAVPGDDRYAASTHTFEVEAMKAAQDAITVTSAATGTYGTSYTLSATGGSGAGAVSYEVVSGPATVTGDKLTFNKAGTVVVKAKKAGDATYEAAESAEFTVTVAKKAITIQLSNYEVNIDTQLPSAYGFELAEGSSWAAGDSKSSIVLTYSNSADIAKAGDYDLTATLQANDKYDVTILKGKITVKGAPTTEKKGGCGGAIGAGSAIAGVAALAMATGIVLTRKRKEEK